MQDLLYAVETSPTHFMWILSLLIEFTLLIRMLQKAWRRMYPRFLAYLLFDLTVSVVLYWINEDYPSDYSALWKIAQVLLVLGRTTLVIESYQKIATLDQRWQMPSVILPGCVGAGLLLHVIMEGPLRWPDSFLEPVFGLIATSNALLGFALVGILISARHAGLNRTVQYRHGSVLCTYLLLTASCYYAATHHLDTIGISLMIVATTCYLAWLVASFRFLGTRLA